jgi:predicted RecA/RadA family phage recombinase
MISRSKMLSLLLGLSFFAGMINYIQPGNAITAAAPYQRNTGQGALLGGSLFGVAVDTVASGATGVFWTEGVFELTKLSAPPRASRSASACSGTTPTSA